MAAEVIAPPYDVINTEEASDLVKGRPNSFLHISKPEIDLEPDVAYNDPRVYQKGRENLDQMIKDEILIEDHTEMLYLYEMIHNGIHQLGIAAVGSVDAYEQDLIKRHEYTKPDKELDRVNNIASLDAQTGPVLMTYQDNNELLRMSVKALMELYYDHKKHNTDHGSRLKDEVNLITI